MLCYVNETSAMYNFIKYLHQSWELGQILNC